MKLLLTVELLKEYLYEKVENAAVLGHVAVWEAVAKMAHCVISAVPYIQELTSC